ncbi:MAG: hypothetical protein ABIR70_05690 [Bryobacteraceae bacterium]
MAADSLNSKLVDEFSTKRPLYDGYASKLEDLIKQILQVGGINVHSVTCRAKDVASFEKKINRADNPYGALGEVTDLAGVRVITYFHDDVEKAAKLIESEFQIDALNSVNKKTLLDPDRFGYVSVHYVLSLSDQRCALTEYRKFQSLKAEIQVRSLLQHTWAEIEHDLGYKSAAGVPASVRRRFARLAGLLELADDEFAAIRDGLVAYQQEIPDQIKNDPERVLLDQTSLRAFIEKSEVLDRISSGFVSDGNIKRVPISDQALSLWFRILTKLKIDTAAQLDALLHQNEADIRRYADVWKAARRGTVVQEGIGIALLQHIIMAARLNPEEISEILEDSGSIRDPKKLAGEILARTKIAGLPTLDQTTN